MIFRQSSCYRVVRYFYRNRCIGDVVHGSGDINALNFVEVTAHDAQRRARLHGEGCGYTGDVGCGREGGKKGQKITLLVSESLTDEGACNQRQTGRQHYYEYTLKGEGVETWHPRFSYYGFRYIQVEGAVLKGQKNHQVFPFLQEGCSG